jgi:hypothetical protein
MSNKVDQSIDILSSFYNVSAEQVRRVLDNTFEVKNIVDNNTCKLKNKNIILPFCGVINDECCKGVIYNHGLYTQCIKVTSNEVCKTCSKLKYGRIEERIKSDQSEFVTPDGKKEVPYIKFMAKMNYSIDDVKQELKLLNLSYILSEFEELPEKKGRGRPKKVQKEESDNEDTDEIEVIKIELNGKIYFKTSEDIILNINTYEVVGILKNDKLEPVDIQ